MSIHTAQHQGIEADIARLEQGIKKLKVQYDMFFAGALAHEPVELRTQLENIIKTHRNGSIRKYHHRFHFNAMVSRFNILSELWGRTVRTIEEGTRRSAAANGTASQKERLVARCLVSASNGEDRALPELYSRFLEARRVAGAAGREVSYDSFVRGISSQTERLQKSSGCGEIELRLVVRDQKVQLKARPGR